jgi:hypothetical protein
MRPMHTRRRGLWTADHSCAQGNDHNDKEHLRPDICLPSGRRGDASASRSEGATRNAARTRGAAERHAVPP